MEAKNKTLANQGTHVLHAVCFFFFEHFKFYQISVNQKIEKKTETFAGRKPVMLRLHPAIPFFNVLLILKAYSVKLGGRTELDQNHKTALGVKIRNCRVESNG